MNTTMDLNVSNIVGELVKNSVDAQCNAIQVEFNESFDFRVIDDGCGFDEQSIQDIGERQVFQFRSQALPKNRFRYGKHGKFLLKIARNAAAEIFVESIRLNSDVRLYRSIIANSSSYKTSKTDRNDKDALGTTAQGSMVVLNTLNLNIDDAARLKANIVNTVVDLSLINFEVNISVRDTATLQILYASCRTKNLFDKFEQFLESHNFFSNIHSLSCEKHDVKVELLLCEIGTSSKTFQFVYFNKLIEHDGKWRKFINKLCKNRYVNDLNSKCPVYLVNIFAENYLNNQLAYNLIIDNCIRKCVDQLSQPAANRTSVTQQTASKEVVVPNNHVATSSKDHPPQINGIEVKGVGLGDYIFNNSSENYEQLNLDRDIYRKKICENWIISLDKPTPKDLADDSLRSVVINRSTTIQQDLFKKPKPKGVKLKRSSHKMVTEMKSASQISTQLYKPSQQVRAFNNSSLLRASKKLITKTSTDTLTRVRRKASSKNRHENRFELKEPISDIERNAKKPTNYLNLMPINQMDALPNDDELSETFKAPLYFTATQKTLDFRWNKQTTNFNMDFSSSIAIRTISDDDPFNNFLGNNGSNSMRNLFESVELPPIAPKSQIQTETNWPSTQMPQEMTRMRTQMPKEINRPSRQAVYSSQTSELRYQHHQKNNSVHTHRSYRQRTHHSFVSDNSANSIRSGRSSGVASKSVRSKSNKSVQNSTQTATAVAPLQKPNSQMDLLSDNVLKAGCPVTININFGGQPR